MGEGMAYNIAVIVPDFEAMKKTTDLKVGTRLPREVVKNENIQVSCPPK